MQSTATHPDGYRLITYRAEDNTSSELVWNSRDRAAPRTILLRDGRTARRVPVHEPYLPNHVPAIGHLVLVDCTEDWAWDRADHLAATMWAAGRHEGHASVDHLAAAIYGLFEVDVQTHHGVAVDVTPELAAAHGWRVSA